MLFRSARVSLMTSLQYRVDFVVEGFMSLFWLSWNLMPLLVLYGSRETVAGWDQSSALVVIGMFVVLRALVEGVISPSLVDFVARVRNGSFDYVLLRPADAQVLVSLARFAPWRIIDLLGGLGLIGYALYLRGVTPRPIDIALGAGLLLCGAVAMYSLYLIAASITFWVVKLDNLAFFLSALIDTARWPVHVFSGAWRILFTFVLPLALMTTYPAMALLGRLDGRTALACAGGALAMLVLARLVWRRAIRSYTSAA